MLRFSSLMKTLQIGATSVTFFTHEFQNGFGSDPEGYFVSLVPVLRDARLIFNFPSGVSGNAVTWNVR
jgi:hypothetical protein